MKHIFKQLIPYLVAMVIGIVIMIMVTPYAKAQRTDPSLIGGEVLIPFLAILLVLIVRSIRNDIRSGMFSDDEDDE